MKTVIVLYGSQSPEHEVSIITALQAMRACQAAGYSIVPIYLTKKGDWLTGGDFMFQPESYANIADLESKASEVVIKPNTIEKFFTTSLFGTKALTEKVDAIFPILHGNFGEEGSVQGLIKLLNLPVVGMPLSGAAIGMDKYISKIIAKSVGITVAKDVLVIKNNWKNNKEALLKIITSTLGEKVFVKPNSLGSTVGISFVKNIADLENAIDVAFTYDTRVLVEEALEDIREINISIIGNEPYNTSITEEPVSKGDFLSFDDKYLSNTGKNKTTTKQESSQGMASADRVMPAAVDDTIITKVETYAKDFFTAIGGKGLSRIDFIIANNTIYFNEINTIPGSLSFYLWEKSKYPFSSLMETLVTNAIELHKQEQNLVNTFDSNILAKYNANSVKGSKI